MSLYTREYYERVRERLNPDGFCSQWLPIHQLDPLTIRRTIKAFVDVFPHTILVSGWRDDLILVGSGSPFEFDAAHLLEALEDRLMMSGSVTASRMVMLAKNPGSTGTCLQPSRVASCSRRTVSVSFRARSDSLACCGRNRRPQARRP